MSSKMTILLAILAVFGICLPVWGQPWDGNGVEGDPYLIYTAEDMQAIGADANYWDGHFLLCDDIDLSAYKGTEFNIIGNYVYLNSEPFTGVFDGNGKYIINFTYNSHSKDGVGLFGCVEGTNAQIKNLGIIDPDVDAHSYIGSVVGFLVDGTISNCYVNGGNVTANYTYSHVGGLNGRNEGGNILYCYTDVTVTGVRYVGGLVGANDEGTISNSYSRAVASGTQNIGGLVGHDYHYGDIYNCYSTGNVSGTQSVGGLIGSKVNNTLTDCFWDIETSGQSSGVGSGSSTGVTGKTTAEMHTESTFTDAGWDFTTPVWKICEQVDYPRLSWEEWGTEENPYLIFTASQMQGIGVNPCIWDKHFKLIGDIDLIDYGDLVPFNMIGDSTTQFTGVFDGNGHKIYNFSYFEFGASNVGIFRFVNDPNSQIKDLGLINPYVFTGSMDIMVGALVGRLTSGTVIGCYVEGGIVSAHSSVGGLVGNSREDGVISNCISSASVSGDLDLGGVVGINLGEISNCFSSGSVTGGDYVGGIASYNNNEIINSHSNATVVGIDVVGGLIGSCPGSISKCYFSGSVEGNRIVGGVVGVSTGVVSNCYSTGDVLGNERVGGLVGRTNTYPQHATISQCYSSGRVDGTTNIGGLVGYDYGGYYMKCFWDSTINLSVQGIGNTTDPNVIGETTENMQTESIFTDAGWDFVGELVNGPNDVWKICEGTNYPKFAWQIPLVGDFVCPDGVNFLDYAVLADQWRLEELSWDVGPDGGDGFVDFLDWSFFANGWHETADMDDLGNFVEQWLQPSAYCADIAPKPNGDGFVDMQDFAVLAENWLEGF